MIELWRLPRHLQTMMSVRLGYSNGFTSGSLSEASRRPSPRREPMRWSLGFIEERTTRHACAILRGTLRRRLLDYELTVSMTERYGRSGWHRRRNF